MARCREKNMTEIGGGGREREGIKTGFREWGKCAERESGESMKGVFRKDCLEGMRGKKRGAEWVGEDEGVKEDTAEIAEKQKGRQREQYRDRQGHQDGKKTQRYLLRWETCDRVSYGFCMRAYCVCVCLREGERKRLTIWAKLTCAFLRLFFPFNVQHHSVWVCVCACLCVCDTLLLINLKLYWSVTSFSVQLPLWPCSAFLFHSIKCRNHFLVGSPVMVYCVSLCVGVTRCSKARICRQDRNGKLSHNSSICLGSTQ